ncbi:prefoldin subunit, partial [Reticulomyxa filosa]
MSEQTETSLFKTTVFDIFKSDLSPQQVAESKLSEEEKHIINKILEIKLKKEKLEKEKSEKEHVKKEFSDLNDHLLFVGKITKFISNITGRENKKTKWSIVMDLIKLLTNKTTPTPKQLQDELAKLQSLELSSDENEALQTLIKLKQKNQVLEKKVEDQSSMSMHDDVLDRMLAFNVRSKFPSVAESITEFTVIRQETYKD